MGRPPKGKVALSGAERTRLWRERLRASQPPKPPASPEAAALARARARIRELEREIEALRVATPAPGKGKRAGLRMDAVEQRINEEVRRRIAEADDATRADNKRLRADLLATNRLLRQTATFTLAEFNVLRHALHPDRIERFGDADLTKRVNAAIQLLNEKKSRLVGPA